MGIVELTPFLYPEAIHLGVDMMTHWVRGGYPDACSEKKEVRWQRWQESYVKMLIERDLPRSSVKLSPVQMRRFMGMVAHQQGGLLKASELGRSMGVSYHTVNHYLDVLEGYFLIRRLQPYYVNINKRLVKSPKIYFRDSGVLHYLLGIMNERLLLQSPLRGKSWEGYLIEQIISMEQIHYSGSQFFYYRTHAGAEIDLIIDRGQERIGFEFKSATAATQRDWSTLHQCLSDGMINQGYLLYLGERNFQVSDRIEVVNAASYLHS